MNEALRKKYIPMTETIYYTLLALIQPRHGYAVIQYVNVLSGGRITLGTGTLYTMVGRLTADGVIVTLPGREKKTYQITQEGMALLTEETERLERQLADGRKMLSGGGIYRTEETGRRTGCRKFPGRSYFCVKGRAARIQAV